MLFRSNPTATAITLDKYSDNNTLAIRVGTGDAPTLVSFPAAQWVHIAVTVDASNVFTLWINGQSAYTTTMLFDSEGNDGTFQMGQNGTTEAVCNCYLDELRFTKGVARYTSPFTPPTEPFYPAPSPPPPPAAPVLTAPTTTSVTYNAATVGATTNIGSGTLYAAVTTSAVPPTSAAIIAGTGFAGAGNQVVTTTGAKQIAITGLQGATTYYHHIVQNGAPGGISNIQTSPSFTTATPPPPPYRLWDRVVLNQQGRVLAQAGILNTVDKFAAISTNDGQSFTLTQGSQIDLAGSAVASNTNGTYMEAIANGAANSAAQLLGDVTTTPGTPPVVRQNNVVTQDYRLFGYPRTTDGDVVNCLSIWSDGTTYYIVGVYLNIALPQGIRIFTSANNGVLTDVGPMSQDPSDPNLLPPTSPASWGSFVTGALTNSQEGQNGLRRINGRWWFVTSRAAYYTDTVNGTSLWRWANLGFNEQTLQNPEVSISGVVNPATNVLVAFDRTGSLTKSNVSVSRDNGTTWTSSRPSGQSNIGVPTNGVALNGTVIAYTVNTAGNTAALRLATPYTTWTVTPVTGLQANHTVINQVFRTTSGVLLMTQDAAQPSNRLLTYSTDGVAFTTSTIS